MRPTHAGRRSGERPLAADPAPGGAGEPQPHPDDRWGGRQGGQHEADGLEEAVEDDDEQYADQRGDEATNQPSGSVVLEPLRAAGQRRSILHVWIAAP